MKILLSILLLCTILLADRDGGPYIGLGYGVSNYDDNNLYEEQKVDDAIGIALYGGAYINRHLSVEVGYVDFNIKDDFIVIDDETKEKMLTFSSLNVSTLAHYAFFDDILDFYAKFGVGSMSVSGAGGSSFTMLYGGGVGVRFSTMLSMKVAFDRYLIEYKSGVSEQEMYIDYIYVAFEVQF